MSYNIIYRPPKNWRIFKMCAWDGCFSVFACNGPAKFRNSRTSFCEKHNPLHHRRLVDARYAIIRAPIFEELICAHCVKPFILRKTPQRVRPRLYCSRECSGLAGRIRYKHDPEMKARKKASARKRYAALTDDEKLSRSIRIYRALLPKRGVLNQQQSKRWLEKKAIAKAACALGIAEWPTKVPKSDYVRTITAIAKAAKEVL